MTLTPMVPTYLLILLTGCAVQPATISPTVDGPVLANDLEKSSYAQGVQYAELMQGNEIGLDGRLFLLGIQDVQTKQPPRLNPEQMQRGRDWVYVQQMLYMDRTAKKNIAEGEAFLKANKAKPGIVCLPNGVQYKIIKDSRNSKKPATSDTVSLRYKVSSLNGEVFFSTPHEAKPAFFKVGTLLPGWQAGLLEMPVNSVWQFYIPGPLAYGENVAPESHLKPNELVMIETELLEIVPPDKAKTLSQNQPIIKKTSSW